MAVVEAILTEVEQRRLTRARCLRDRTNVFEIYDDEALIRDFRFPKHTILEIIEICATLTPKIKSSLSIPIHLQILAALRFFARGVFQDDGKDILGMSQVAFGRCVHRVTTVLVSKASQYIRFPDDVARLKQKQKFYAMGGIPNTFGLIDGTHVFILTPRKEVEPNYVCRKGGHSINVQITCDSEALFTNVVAKWPGSTHDAYIWSNSAIRRQFSQNLPDGFILGDSAYPIEPWLQTPYAQTPTESHVAYNKAHKKTRSLVERAIGLWKSCFRRFDKSGGVLMYTPRVICRFIIASTVLHNIRRRLRIPEDEHYLENDEETDERHENYENSTPNELMQIGLQIRDNIRNEYFT